MPKRHRRFLPAVTAAAGLLLSGCAPLWPAIGTAKTSECVADNLGDALAFADTTGESFASARAQGEGFKQGAALVLWGIGTGTGAAVAFDGSKDLLKGLALGAASVLGLNAIAAPDAQRQVMNAGEEAVQCLVRAAKASAKGDTVAAVPALPASHAFVQKSAVEGARARAVDTLVRASAEAGQAISSRIADATTATRQLQAQRSAVPSSATTASAHHAVTLGLTLGSLARLTNSTVVAQKAAAMSDVDVAKKLSHGVCEVRRKVSDNLYAALPKLDDIAKAQADSVGKLIGEQAKAQKDAKEAKKDVAEQVSKAAVAGDQELAADLKKVTDAAADAAGDEASAVWDDCVAKASPPPKATS